MQRALSTPTSGKLPDGWFVKRLEGADGSASGEHERTSPESSLRAQVEDKGVRSSVGGRSSVAVFTISECNPRKWDRGPTSHPSSSCLRRIGRASRWHASAGVQDVLDGRSTCFERAKRIESVTISCRQVFTCPRTLTRNSGRRSRRATFRASFGWQNPQTEANGRKRTRTAAKP
jgi:hypothetical protein